MTTPSSDTLTDDSLAMSGLMTNLVEEGDSQLTPTGPVDQRTILDLKKRIIEYRRMFLLITVTSAAMTFSNLPLVNYVKNELKATPSELILFATTSRLGTFLKPLIGHVEDTYTIFGFKIKSYTLIYAIGSSLMCISIVFDHSHLYLLCAQVSLLTIFDCVGGALAEGMTAITLKYQQRLAQLDPALEKSSDSANFGYLQVLGNMIRMIGTFVGGYYGTDMNFTAVYTTMSTFPALVALYSMLFFNEDREFYKRKGNNQLQEELPVWTKLRKIFDILVSDALRNPVSIVLLSIIIPSYGDFFIFILTDPKLGNWTFKTMAYSTLVSGVVYAFCMAFLLVRIATFPFKRLYLIGATAFLLSALAVTTLPFADKLTREALFGLMVLATVIGAVGSDCVIIPTVGKFSSMCPKGLENLGVSSFTMILLLFTSISGYLSSPIISAFDVKEGSYGNIFIPFVITACCRFVVVLIIPFVVKS
jgi:hypothetical protein